MLNVIVVVCSLCVFLSICLFECVGEVIVFSLKVIVLFLVG